MTTSAADFRGRGSGTTMGIGLIQIGEPDPRTYARFAEEDLAGADCPRRRVNALSNSKRALHLQIQLLTDALGYTVWQSGKYDGFPQRLQFTKQTGLIAPPVLAKVNRLRNAIEHDYIVPEREAVEDYADVVSLYLEASDRFVRSLPHVRELYTDRGGSKIAHCLRTRRGSGRLKLYECGFNALVKSLPEADKRDPISPPDERDPHDIDPVFETSLDKSPDEYFEWLRVLLGVDE